MTAAPSLPEIKIDAHASADEARAFLERDRLMAAYALADIDQPEIEGARWWIARRDGDIAAVVLVVEGLPFRPCFATGASDGLAALFREAIREPRVLLATPPRSRGAIELTYRFERVDHMRRMVVNVNRFRPRVNQEVTRLGADHLDSVIDLYGHASRTYFTPERLRREIYLAFIRRRLSRRRATLRSRSGLPRWATSDRLAYAAAAWRGRSPRPSPRRRSSSTVTWCSTCARTTCPRSRCTSASATRRTDSSSKGQRCGAQAGSGSSAR